MAKLIAAGSLLDAWLGLGEDSKYLSIEFANRMYQLNVDEDNAGVRLRMDPHFFLADFNAGVAWTQLRRPPPPPSRCCSRTPRTRATGRTSARDGSSPPRSARAAAPPACETAVGNRGYAGRRVQERERRPGEACSPPSRRTSSALPTRSTPRRARRAPRQGAGGVRADHDGRARGEGGRRRVGGASRRRRRRARCGATTEPPPEIRPGRLRLNTASGITHQGAAASPPAPLPSTHSLHGSAQGGQLSDVARLATRTPSAASAAPEHAARGARERLLRRALVGGERAERARARLGRRRAAVGGRELRVVRREGAAVVHERGGDEGVGEARLAAVGVDDRPEDLRLLVELLEVEGAQRAQVGRRVPSTRARSTTSEPVESTSSRARSTSAVEASSKRAISRNAARSASTPAPLPPSSTSRCAPKPDSGDSRQIEARTLGRSPSLNRLEGRLLRRQGRPDGPPLGVGPVAGAATPRSRSRGSRMSRNRASRGRIRSRS